MFNISSCELVCFARKMAGRGYITDAAAVPALAYSET